MDFDSALPIFEEEARELLLEMEKSLLQIEGGESNKNLINSIFRAAHTIKGSGGMFGLDKVVSFTHHVESLMDEIRQDKQQLSSALVSLLMECGDHIGNLVSESLGQTVDLEALTTNENQLLSKLSKFLKSIPDPLNQNLEESLEEAPAIEKQGNESTSKSADTAPSAVIEKPDGPLTSGASWFVKVTFGEGVMRDGVDPMSVISYLSSMGTLSSIKSKLSPAASLEKFDPESCYLESELLIQGDLDEGQIRAAFEFIQDQSEVTIKKNVLPSELPIDEAASVPDKDVEKSLPTEKQAVQLEDHGVVAPKPTVESPKTPNKSSSVSKNASESKFIRVEASKLDQLIDLIGELVIAGASNSLIANRTNSQDMLEAASTVSSLVESIRDAALNLRMIPIGATFERFNRLVRELSIELDKNIKLEITGADTELDKSVVEKITDPLTHLVRNSIDHGIENKLQRVTSGKSEEATLQLNAYHDSGSIVIEVADDGKGLDRDKIRNTAIKRGLISSNAILTDEEVEALIFEPGFSTAESVTNLSGRGVGMDVVRQNIQSLRGTIEIESSPGVGTVSRIRLPLTLAIIDGFLVSVGHDSYVIPLSMIIECVELRKGDIETNQGRNYVNLRGELLPFVRIREVFETNTEMPVRENIVVVNYAGRAAGLVVDELIGDFQTVIKPLGPLFSAIQGVSGSTILGNGDVGLILDVPTLIQLVTQRESIASKEAVL